ncbi:hypothetical protein B0H13DRAFT_1988876, partial [Mycena leptocephala]
RLSNETNILQLISVIQSYVIMVFAFAVLAKAPSFGENADCNQEAVAVIFRPFSALRHGRIFGWCTIGLMFVTYTITTARDYLAKIKDKKKKKKSQRSQNESKSPQSIFKYSDTAARAAGPSTLNRATTSYGPATAFVDHQLLVILFLILIIWVFLVLNTELIIRFYPPTEDDSVTNWQFGQILPMFLPVLPFINMVSAFKEFGLKPTKRVLREVEMSVIP